MMTRIYYHGTNPRFLYAIATQGFKLGEQHNGRVHGRGLYIATQPETAGIWASQSWVDKRQYAIKCKLHPGTKIIWKDLNYDRKIIRYLEKKFGKDISRDYEFWKHIPSNKRLTNSELLALVSHLDYARSCLSVAGSWFNSKVDKFDDKKHRHLSRFSKLLRQYGYDALGDRTEKCWDSDDICVYNPSKVTFVSAHRITVKWDHSQDRPERVDYSHPLGLDELKDISEKEEADWQCWLAELEAKWERELAKDDEI